MRQISTLPAGLYEVLIKPKRGTRTLNQNAYLHVAIVEPFREWVRENWGENIDHDQAFETLKLSVMEIARVEGLPIMPSTRKLDKAEFGELIENSIQFLATKCDIAVIPPELFFEERKQKCQNSNR